MNDTWGAAAASIKVQKDKQAPEAAAKPASKTILFNLSKHETHHPSSGFKRLYRRLRSNYKVSLNKDEITAEKFEEAALVIFGGPREKFSAEEFEALKSYMASTAYLARPLNNAHAQFK